MPITLKIKKVQKKLNQKTSYWITQVGYKQTWNVTKPQYIDAVHIKKVWA